MLKRTLVLVALVFSLALPLQAGPGAKAIQLSNMLQVLEDHGLVLYGLQPVNGNSHGNYLPRLVAAAERRGLFVVFIQEGLGDIWGFTDIEASSLYINASLSQNAQLSTLFHELGHALGPKQLHKSRDGQVFAESLAVLACQELKLDTRESSYGYLQQFPQRHDVLLKYSKDIDTLVNALVAEVR